MWLTWISSFIIVAVAETILTTFILVRNEELKQASFSEKLSFFWINLGSSLFNPLIYALTVILVLVRGCL